jgi:hypothetical protein
MAKQKTPKLTYKTPLLPLQWVVISGQGRLKYKKEDNGDPENYQYQATAVFPDEASMKKEKAKFDKFWRENKPAGLTKQKYSLFKPEEVPDLDKDGKEQKDEDDAVIMKPTGRWLLAAKTNVAWPDGKPNKVKLLRANGSPLNIGDKGIGEGSTGVIHGQIGFNTYEGNEGLLFFLTGVQLKKFVEYVGEEIEADDLGEDEGMDDLDIDSAEAIDESAEDTPDV